MTECDVCQADGATDDDETELEEEEEEESEPDLLWISDEMSLSEGEAGGDELGR